MFSFHLQPKVPALKGHIRNRPKRDAIHPNSRKAGQLSRDQAHKDRVDKLVCSPLSECDVLLLYCTGESLLMIWLCQIKVIVIVFFIRSETLILVEPCKATQHIRV